MNFNWLRIGQLFFVFFSLTAVMSCTHKDDHENALNIAVRADVKGFDPVFASDNYSHMVVSQIYEGLLQYHYLKDRSK